VPEYIGELSETLKGADAAIILVAHDEYVDFDWHQALDWLRTPVIVDARHVLPDDFTVEHAEIRILGRG
ncbi:MAG TPA: UDP binding domain-containing protein, partial [Aggregatilineales bacterium]|nr:UDP binding domain-containing protein [Aggregatilineales bacterium]